MAFIDQGEFEAMKTLSSRRVLRCDKHQSCAKMMVSTSTISEISLLNTVVITRNMENGTFMTAHLCLVEAKFTAIHVVVTSSY